MGSVPIFSNCCTNPLMSTVPWRCSQSYVVAVLTPNVVHVCVVEVRHGCMHVLLTLSRLPFPATDQMWLTSMPEVQPCSCVSATAVGPRPHFLAPRALSEALGERNTEPTPQIHPPRDGAFGDKKKLCVMSPRPAVLSPPGTDDAAEITGIIVRIM